MRSALGYRGDLRFGGGPAAEGTGVDVALRQAQLHGAMRISLWGGSSLFWPGPAAAGAGAEVQLRHITPKKKDTKSQVKVASLKNGTNRSRRDAAEFLRMRVSIGA